MPFSVESVWPLALMTALPLMWWARQHTLLEFDPRQLNAQFLLRGAAVVLVALALMEPVWFRPTARLAVAYLLDISQSVEPRAIESAIEWIELAEEQGDADVSRFLAFGRNVVASDDAASLRQVRVGGGGLDRSATDIEAAFDAALASLPAEHVGRVVLLSDGWQTTGDADAATGRLKELDSRIYTVPLRERGNGDAWLDAVEAPSYVTAGMPFDLRVVVASQRAVRARLVVEIDGRLIDRRSIDLAVGTAELFIEASLEDAGAAIVRVTLESDGDPVPDNNTWSLAVHAGAPSRVLYVEGQPTASTYLRRALEDGGFEVDITAPWALPLRPGDLAAYDAVLLSDIDPTTLNPASMEALASYVETLGGGLILTGGESVYGEEGYTDTAIERILPVWFRAEREPKDLALVIALDKSYSMVGDKMALAKEASKAAVELLEDDQRFGLLAFDYHFYWPVPLASAADKDRIRARIASIEASSPTNIYPALQDVYAVLLPEEAEVKHVILLSDGKTYEDDYEELVTRMAEADITVSTVAVGDKADRELLSNIATWGEGRAYYIEDPTKVPEIFVDETQMAAGITIEEGSSVRPVVVKQIEALTGIDLETAPALLGFVRTMAKENAEIVLESDEGDPLLARWQYGLGHTVLFASDVKNRWAVDWLDWEGYGKFWAQLVRETMRQPEFRGPELQLVPDADSDGRSGIQLDLVDANGRLINGQRPQVDVMRADGTSLTIELAQAAPGRYEALLPATRNGLEVSYRDDSGNELSRRIAPEFPAELRYRPPNREALTSWAVATGGSHDPSPDQVHDADGQRVVQAVRLRPGLIAAALIAYLLNMLLRRVRVFGREAAIV